MRTLLLCIVIAVALSASPASAQGHPNTIFRHRLLVELPSPGAGLALSKGVPP
jgi:hypothetical protein